MSINKKLYVSLSLGLAVAVASAGSSLPASGGVPPPDVSNYVFASQLGTLGSDASRSVAVDRFGRIYVAGWTDGLDFLGALRSTSYGPRGGGQDGFVARLSADGSTLDFAVIIGGSENDVVNSVAVDDAGRVYLAGFTASTDFPTSSAVQSTSGGGGDGFILALDPDTLALDYSTYLGGGGDDIANGIAATPSGEAVVAARLRDQAVVLQFDANGGGPVASVAIADGSAASADALTLGVDGSIYVTGTGFVARLRPSTLAIDSMLPVEWSGGAVALDTSGTIHVAGIGFSSDGIKHIVVSAVSADGTSLTSERVIRVQNHERINVGDIALDESGNLYLATNEDNGQETTRGVLRRISPEGRVFWYQVVAWTLYGLAARPTGEVWVAGASGNPGQLLVVKLAFVAIPGAPPVITSVERGSKPRKPRQFRTIIRGSNFLPGAVVFVDGSLEPDAFTIVKGETRINVKFDYLRSGPRTFTVINPDGAQASFLSGSS